MTFITKSLQKRAVCGEDWENRCQLIKKCDPMDSRLKNSGTGLIKNRASWTHCVDLVFLVGYPRSCSTWLQSMLAGHSEIYTEPETHFFVSFSRFEENFKYPPAVNIGPAACLTESEFYVFVRGLFWHFISNFTPPKGIPSYFLEGTPHHIDHAQFILYTFPNARFIQLIRDGRGLLLHC
jgi:hypothetical protein